jgi:hypothetical protein
MPIVFVAATIKVSSRGVIVGFFSGGADADSMGLDIVIRNQNICGVVREQLET